MKSIFFEKRELYSRVYLYMISFLGWLTVFSSMLSVEATGNYLILFLLFIFLMISEYYPMPVWRGFTALTFPIVYVIFLLFGFSVAAITYAAAVLLVNLKHQRPLRTIIFNPAQLVLSLYVATIFLKMFDPWIQQAVATPFLQGILQYIVLQFFFFLVNNLIVDIVLMIRPQPYTLKAWWTKTITELNCVLISLLYGGMLYVLGSQNRGDIDVFSYFFFFSPLVGFALLSSAIVRLREEKKRLKSLFIITSQLNQFVPGERWLQDLKHTFSDFINADAFVLWVKEEGNWYMQFQKGDNIQSNQLHQDVADEFEEVKEPVIHGNHSNLTKSRSLFDDRLKAFVYFPLRVEKETVGMLVAARNRTKSFTDEDVQSIATLSNQLAVTIKTRMLFKEKEKRILLEERNRIARDIHDGIAQTLAGAIMKLESAGRRFNKKPEDTLKLMEESVCGLRDSLREVRDSIYALRPYPTERVGLSKAIGAKVDAVKKEFSLNLSFEVRGEEIELSSMVEKVLFDIFQESLQNVIKHAKASSVEILLSYQSENILLRIKDDGVGFSLFQAMLAARERPHFGILQINDSAEKINASLQIDSKEGDGTEVTIIVPKMGLEGEREYDQINVSG
ncbi:GAF domain-containing sensor histidine kinase [Bacillus sp. SCS-153A]|uniref:GAF domain-containing sensor histidine kinase n=1 Tax=Rossellomorea sedimentorum TaxID=3115294 RepID=UPI0039065768